ncbi:MAG: ion transporter [Bacteroidales bacterium]|nr:ion transporter [Bacteroidales bacterium]
MKDTAKEKKPKNWRQRLHEIIFEADTPKGKAFDVILMILIILSVLVVLIDSVKSVNEQIGKQLFIAEWIFTILFSIEYVFRIISTRKPSKYLFSFYGIIDLLAILPTYLSLIMVGSQYLIVIRMLRLLRVFRVLKLARYVGASAVLSIALRNSRHKIVVFLEVVLTIVVIVGSLMYLIEGPANGFSSIPMSIYWAIVTLTTVGYGDIAPQTVAGQTLASLVMILGYAIIAVPTGIISVEMARAGKTNTQVCRNCNYSMHDDDARFCKMCGESLK